jgi:hypothetical protein
MQLRGCVYGTHTVWDTCAGFEHVVGGVCEDCLDGADNVLQYRLTHLYMRRCSQHVYHGICNVFGLKERNVCKIFRHFLWKLRNFLYFGLYSSRADTL